MNVELAWFRIFCRVLYTENGTQSKKEKQPGYPMDLEPTWVLADMMS